MQVSQQAQGGFLAVSRYGKCSLAGKVEGLRELLKCKDGSEVVGRWKRAL